MRIEEMRSGRAYLSKRPAAQVRNFEPRELRLVFPPARPEPRPVIEPQMPASPAVETRVESDLEKSQWTVVAFSGVVAGGLTYDQATRLITALGDTDTQGLCIITDAAALQID